MSDRERGQVIAELSAECVERGWHDLAGAVPRVKGFVDEWWSTPYLPWFTDHGPNHSQRVASYAMQLGRVPSLPEHLRLSTLEKFILWSAAYLHDLGMQSVMGGRLGELGDDDFNRIRHEHPDQTAQEVLAHGDLIGFPAGDTALRQVVAYVARAHGTNYYHDSVAFLSTYTRVRNETVRGSLLASILLIADELDLHYERAKPPAARATLNAISEAHAMKHRRVLSSEVVHSDDGVVRFRVTTEKAPGSSDSVNAELDRWIVEKLRKQIAMVEDEFVAGLGGRASLSRAIILSQVGGRMPGAEPGAGTMDVVESDNARTDLINHQLLFTEATDAIRSRSVAILRGRLADAVGFDGREDLLSAVAGHFKAEGARVLSSFSLAESHGAATYTDVLVELIVCGRAESSGPLADVSAAPNELLSELTSTIAQSDDLVLISISSVDRLPPHELHLLLEVALPRLRSQGDVAITFTASPNWAAPEALRPLVILNSNGLDQPQVTDHLARYTGRGAARAEAGAGLEYWQYKRLCASHLIQLQEEAMRHGA